MLMLAVFGANGQSIQTKPSLTVGSPAPTLDVQHWLKGTPVERFENDRLYVVEFWATWCVPCNAAMPHLSDLARKYHDKVSIIGVSVWEGKKKPVPDVAFMQAFVDKKGRDMDYIAAMDDPATNRVANTWMSAAGLNAIPATFVVDRDGKIAWIGHPNGLESVLEALVNNPEQFNRDLSKEQHNKDFRQNLMFQSTKYVQETLSEKNYGEAWKEMQRLSKEDSAFEPTNFSSFISAYLSYDSKAALAYVLQKSKDADFLQTKDPQKEVNEAGEELLDEFARIAAGRAGLDPAVYYMSITRLNKALEHKPNVANLWVLLAQAYAHVNEPDKAIFAIEKGIEVFQKNNTSSSNQLRAMMNEKSVEKMTAQLAEYKGLKKMKEMMP